MSDIDRVVDTIFCGCGNHVDSMTDKAKAMEADAGETTLDDILAEILGKVVSDSAYSVETAIADIKSAFTSEV